MKLAYLIYSIPLTFKHTLKETTHTKYYNGSQSYFCDHKVTKTVTLESSVTD